MDIIKKEEKYKDFSWHLHQKAGHKPIVAQMELTFRCPLHCEHCYTDCYNNREAIKRELTTKQVKQILDKCKRDGVVWFCFTGGDPLIRNDFVEIYSYARRLGFIITVFSSLVSLNQKILAAFKRYPPFSIETTLNAATPQVYKKITKTNFFKKHIEMIKKLLKEDLPIRIKMQITKQNVSQIKIIKKLVESLGLKFRSSTMIHAQLNKNVHPCTLRLEPKEAIRINKRYGYFEEEKVFKPQEKLELSRNRNNKGALLRDPEVTQKSMLCSGKDLIRKPVSSKLLSCAAGGHAFWISPQGKMFICSTIRKPDYDLLKKGSTVKEGFYGLYKKVHSMCFKTDSRCLSCKYRLICDWCPGRAYLEKGSLEEPIDYFCQLTKESLREYKITYYDAL